MTYHSQLNLIMLATVIGLAVFLYLKPQLQSEHDDLLKISMHEPETVQTIRIIRQEQEIVLRKLAGRWHIVSPFSAKADKEAVGKILTVLSAHSRQRFPLRNTESFNLDRPVIELYIDDDYFAFGGLAPVTNEQYLAINEHVYLVSPRYAIWMPVSPLDLVSRKLLADNEIPVQFELDGLTLDKQNGAWVVDSEERSNLSSELLEHWVEKWRFSQAAELLIDKQDYSDDRPTVKIRLEDGREIKLNIIDNKSGTVFKRSDQQVGHLFSDQVGRLLLDPLTAKPE